jgi:hypothetical protein
LLEDAVQRAGREIVARLSVHGHSPRFGRVLELSVAADGVDVIPAIVTKQLQNLADLHAFIPSAF